MRSWRVGTFSMGASLVFLGLFLFLSRILGYDLIHVMTAWWPILLVVLGIEILVYLVLAKQEKPVLKYDFLSIFFVGLLGTAGIVLAILTSSGLIGKVEEVMAREELSFELPNFSYKMDDSIKRVVAETAGYDMTIESTGEKAISLFGTYQVQTMKKAKLIKASDDYVVANQKGDTLYLTIKALPKQVGPFDTQGTAAATLLIPNNVKLEVTGSDHSFALKPRTLANDWNIETASSIVVDVDKKSDLRISAIGIEDVRGKDGEWKVSGKPSFNDVENSVQKNAVYQAGQGTYRINIANVYNVSLNTN